MCVGLGRVVMSESEVRALMRMIEYLIAESYRLPNGVLFRSKLLKAHKVLASVIEEPNPFVELLGTSPHH